MVNVSNQSVKNPKSVYYRVYARRTPGTFNFSNSDHVYDSKREAVFRASVLKNKMKMSVKILKFKPKKLKAIKDGDNVKTYLGKGYVRYIEYSPYQNMWKIYAKIKGYPTRSFSQTSVRKIK